MGKIKYSTAKDEHAKFVPPVERLLHDIRNSDNPMAAGMRACRWLQGMLFTRSSPEADAVIHALKDRRVPAAQAKDKVIELVGGQKGRRRNPKHRHVINASDLDNFVECERYYLGSKYPGAVLSSLGKPLRSSEKKVQLDSETIRRVMGLSVHSCLKSIHNDGDIRYWAERTLREEIPDLDPEKKGQCLNAVVEMIKALRVEGRIDSWDGVLPADNIVEWFSTKEMIISNYAVLRGKPDWLNVKDGQYRIKEVKTKEDTKQTSPILQLAAYRMLVMATPGFEKVSEIADEIVVARPRSLDAPARARSYDYKITDQEEARVIRSVNKIANYIDSKDKWVRDFASLPASKKAGKSCHLCGRCRMRGTPACPETQERRKPHQQAPAFTIMNPPVRPAGQPPSNV